MENVIKTVKMEFYMKQNDNIIKKYKCEIDNYLICPQNAIEKGLCKKCDIYYYPIENDDSYSPIEYYYYKCYKEHKGYYLDIYNLLYKKIILSKLVICQEMM